MAVYMVTDGCLYGY